MGEWSIWLFEKHVKIEVGFVGFESPSQYDWIFEFVLQAGFENLANVFQTIGTTELSVVKHMRIADRGNAKMQSLLKLSFVVMSFCTQPNKQTDTIG